MAYASEYKSDAGFRYVSQQTPSAASVRMHSSEEPSQFIVPNRTLHQPAAYLVDIDEVLIFAFRKLQKQQTDFMKVMDKTVFYSGLAAAKGQQRTIFVRKF